MIIVLKFKNIIGRIPNEKSFIFSCLASVPLSGRVKKGNLSLLTAIAKITPSSILQKDQPIVAGVNTFGKRLRVLTQLGHYLIAVEIENHGVAILAPQSTPELVHVKSLRRLHVVHGKSQVKKHGRHSRLALFSAFEGRIVGTKFFAKFLNTALGVENLLLASIKRVTFRTNVNLEHTTISSGASLKTIAANTYHFGESILWMNIGPHKNPLLWFRTQLLTGPALLSTNHSTAHSGKPNGPRYEKPELALPATVPPTIGTQHPVSLLSGGLLQIDH